MSVSSVYEALRRVHSEVGPLGKSSGASARGGVALGLIRLSVSRSCLRTGTASHCPLCAAAKRGVDDHRRGPVTVPGRMLSVGVGTHPPPEA